MGKVLGVDYGAARIGLALSDAACILASPLLTLKTKKTSQLTAQELASIVKQHQVETLVIGIPYRMNGKVGLQVDEVRNFISILRELVDCRIVEWDERLTTVQAERAMREAQMSRKKRSHVIDVMAAVIILQAFLDTQGNTLIHNLR